MDAMGRRPLPGWWDAWQGPASSQVGQPGPSAHVGPVSRGHPYIIHLRLAPEQCCQELGLPLPP